MITRKGIFKRYAILFVLLVIFGVVCVAMLFRIGVGQRQRWLKTWDSLQSTNVEVVAPRGEIYDRNGKKLAITEQRFRLYFDPLAEALNKKRVDKATGEEYTYFSRGIDSLCLCLSTEFGGSPSQYRTKINEARKRGYRHIKLVPGTISYHQKEQASKFPIFRLGRNKGGFLPERSERAERNYLYGDIGRKIIGNVNANGGYMGIEKFCDSLLTGVNGVESRQRIAANRSIRMPVVAPCPGKNVHTTFDIDYEEICYQSLMENLAVYPSERACLVLMEVKTGAIRAMVDLQREDGGYAEMGRIENHMALNDLSNPGSTFKSVSLMIAFEDGVCDSSTMVSLNGGRLQYNSAVMVDDHHVVPDTVNLKRVLAESSNVGVSRIINAEYNKKGRDSAFVARVGELGFEHPLTLGLPQSRGVVSMPRIPNPKKTWSRISIPWLSIGYEILTPPIYTLMFYNAIANNGRMVEPYMIDYIDDEKGNKVWSNKKKIVSSKICSTRTLRQLQGMLEGVVERGTARAISKSSVKIAGKTGTAQLKDGKGGLQASFCGYFPAENPKYSCIVVYKRPPYGVYPPQTACRVFRAVAERITSIENERKISDLPRWQSDGTSARNLPKVKNGSRDLIVDAVASTSSSVQNATGEWITVKCNEEGSLLVAEERKINEGVVPNVIGMGATDAVYLLEKAGLLVQVYGVGEVVSQSIYAGTPIKKGATVSITLR